MVVDGFIKQVLMIIIVRGNSMLKVKVINQVFKKEQDLMVETRPMVGDCLPINHMKEKVVDVVFMTPLLLRDNPELSSIKDFDLLVIVE